MWFKKNVEILIVKMEETLSFVDINSLIKKRRDFPSTFSARKLWMIVHKEYPNVSIDEFAKKLQIFSKDEEDIASNDQEYISQHNEIIFEYKVNGNGVRLYKQILKNNEVKTSKEIIRMIKYAMCNLNQPMIQNDTLKIDDLNAQDNDYTTKKIQMAGNNNFMTEIEISEKIGITKERIRPFIRILIELGIIIIEKIERSKHHCPKSINEQNQFESSDFFFVSNDLINSDYKVNERNDSPNIAIDDNDVGNKGEMKYFLQSTNNRISDVDDKSISASKDLSRRYLKWDENQEMRIKNLSSSFEYLNKLRSMKTSLLNSISEAKNKA